MDKIRIFQFPIANSNGGITHYAVDNWRYLDKNRFSCDFGTVRGKLDFEEELISLGAGVKYISCSAEENREKFIEEMTDILKNNYDVIHLHTSFWKSTLVEEIALNCGIPKIIVHSHSTNVDILDDSKRKEAEKVHNIVKQEFNTNLATDFCACSNMAADWLFGEQIPRDKIKIMKNAINVEKFIFNEKTRNKVRAELGLENSFVITNVGRFVYQKNQEFLISVFAEVSKKINNAKLLLVGDGILKDKYKGLVKQLDVEDKVIFTGVRNDIADILQASDVFCLPSRFEGLPITLIEAQTTGLKCLASNLITNEICITENIELLSLEKEIWSEELQNISKGYQRLNMYDQITCKGYNIKEQIKEVEKLYIN